MPLSRSHRLDFWDQCVQELRARRSRFRLRRDPSSPFIYIREVHGGAKVREYSLRPLLCSHNPDVEEARDLCLEGHRRGRWPIHPSPQQAVAQHSWASLVEACVVAMAVAVMVIIARSVAVIARLCSVPVLAAHGSALLLGGQVEGDHLLHALLSAAMGPQALGGHRHSCRPDKNVYV